MKNLTLPFSILLVVVIDLIGGLTLWENLAVCLFVYSLFNFLYNLGKKVVILDLTIIMMSLTCLFMPVIFYHEYTRHNPLALLWRKYMPITTDSYFSFAVPAFIAVTIGLKIPLGKIKVQKNPGIYLDNVKQYLSTRPKLGITLIWIGVVSGLLNFLSPDNLKQVFYLSAHLTHVGVFYVIYSPSKKKKLIVAGVLMLVLGQSLLTGMFGELVFMLACSLVLLLLGKKVVFSKKLAFAIAGIFLILVIQSVKKEYRKRSWGEQGSGADPVYFTELITDRITDPSMMLDPNALFYAACRMNQGWLVAQTIKMVPEKYSFAHGETIWQSVAAAIVPRFLWPDKPETGGKANLKRFWGFNLVGWSTNIGIMGEAYANFDRVGGVIYMLFYGLFFNFILSRLLKMSERRPTLILWIPFLFFSAIAVETDLLSTMGALIKGLIFTWLVFKIFKTSFHIDL